MLFSPYFWGLILFKWDLYCVTGLSKPLIPLRTNPLHCLSDNFLNQVPLKIQCLSDQSFLNHPRSHWVQPVIVGSTGGRNAGFGLFLVLPDAIVGLPASHSDRFDHFLK